MNHRLIHSMLALAVCLGPAMAQSLPVTRSTARKDLVGAGSDVLMKSDVRMQQFYAVREIGRSTVSVRAVSLRFDGPSAGAALAQHTIGSLEISIGSTGRAIDELTADFEFNLTRPLHPIVQRQQFVYHTDARATGVDAWGGHARELYFKLATPVVIQVPAGGCLVFEMRIADNSNGMAGDSALLDYHADTRAVTKGVAITEGTGCWHGVPMTVDTIGDYEPGAAFFISGSGMPANSPIAMLVTERLVDQPFVFPGSLNCWVYADVATGFLLPMTSDFNGNILPESESSGVPLPRSPRMRGSLLYVQAVAPMPVGSPYGTALTSDYRTIKIGDTPSPRVRAWNVSSDAGSDAPIANRSRAGALALRID